MIAAHGDDARESSAVLADARFGRGGGGSSVQEHVVPLFHLVNGKVIVERSDRDVAAVDDAAPGIEWIVFIRPSGFSLA